MRCKICNAFVMQLVACEVYWCSHCGSLCHRYEKGGDEWTTPKYRAILEKILLIPNSEDRFR